MWRNFLYIRWCAFGGRSHPFLCSISWSTKSRSWKWYGLLNWAVQMKLAGTVMCWNTGDRRAFCLTLKRCQKLVEKFSCQRWSNRAIYSLRATEILYLKIKLRQSQYMLQEEHMLASWLKTSVQSHTHSYYNWPCQSGICVQWHFVSCIFSLTAEPNCLFSQNLRLKMWLAKVALRVEIRKILNTKVRHVCI